MANQWLASAAPAPVPVRREGLRDLARRHVFLLAVPAAILADALVIHLMFRLTYALRYEWKLLAPWPHAAPPWEPYFWGSWFVAVLWVGVMAALGMYRDRRGHGHFDDAVLLTFALALGTVLALAASFFYREFSFSRLVLVFGAGFTWFALTAWHYVLRQTQRALLRRGWGALNTLIVGCNSLSETVGTRLYRHPEIGHRLVGFVPANDENVGGDRWIFPAWSREHNELAGWGPVLGTLADLERIVAVHRIDEVVLAVPGAAFHQLFELMNRCAQAGRPVRFRIVPDLTELVTAKLAIDELDGVPTLAIRDVPLRKPVNRFLKRTLDIAFAAGGLLALAPLLGAIALAVRADGGPALFRQERMGRDGRLFQLIKFRTMVLDAEAASGPVWTSKVDSRVTRLGAFLRRWSLDELPQIWNVLVGDMSLVGPRPERPYFVDQFRIFVPKYMDRHLVRCGLTGWAQINGLRGEEGSIEERTRYDIYYIENWSLLFDLKILLRTLYEVVVHKAY
ncbi:MAG: sugar transferase [Candidatus Sericytochromatia bacterium]|nr:sugar transferase [Candidatus Tanganyikabacteria bacterium]